MGAVVEDVKETERKHVNPILASEVRFAISTMKEGKASGNDGLAIDLLKVADDVVTSKIATIFTEILRSHVIPKDWTSGVIVLLHKKGDRRDLKNYRPITLLPHLYKLFTRIICNRISRTLDENQSTEQAGFRKTYSTIDHIHTVTQLIEKTNEYQQPLCIGFIDFEKAFDSVKHDCVFNALNKQGVEAQYIQILRKLYTEAKAVIRIEEESKPFDIERGVRQGDPISPKLFTALLEDMFMKLDWEKKGIAINGKYLSHLKFADDIVVFANKLDDLEEMINELTDASSQYGLKLNAEKTKFMRNRFVIPKQIKTNGVQLKEVDRYVYLGQMINMTKGIEEEISRRCALAWQAFARGGIIFKSDLPMCLKRKAYDQCILLYGSETWQTTKKQRAKLIITQRAMERTMLKITRRDRMRNTWIREKTKVKDVLSEAAKQKWRWAGHVARQRDGRWTKEVTEWYPKSGRRRRGRQKTRWMDDIVSVAGNNWISAAQERAKWKLHVEAFIHPAVDR
jgi:hypothetical protein